MAAQQREIKRYKTAFAINGGKFEFTRLPFGLKNSPSNLQRALDDILRDHFGRILYVYSDDIIAFNQSDQSFSQNDHSKHNYLHDHRQGENDLYMYTYKSTIKLFKTKVGFLGCIISANGGKPTPRK